MDSHEGKVLLIVAVMSGILIVITDGNFSAADSDSLGIFLGICQDTLKHSRQIPEMLRIC